MPSLSLWNAKAVPLGIYTNTVDRVRLILEFQVEHLCTFAPSLFDIIDNQFLGKLHFLNTCRNEIYFFFGLTMLTWLNIWKTLFGEGLFPEIVEEMTE